MLHWWQFYLIVDKSGVGKKIWQPTNVRTEVIQSEENLKWIQLREVNTQTFTSTRTVISGVAAEPRWTKLKGSMGSTEQTERLTTSISATQPLASPGRQVRVLFMMDMTVNRQTDKQTLASPCRYHHGHHQDHQDHHHHYHLHHHDPDGWWMSESEVKCQQREIAA